MAGRPLKQGLDYFSLDVDFFQNAKARRIIKAQGYQSISVLICLLSNIYRKDGYFLKWDENMPFLVADELGVGASECVVTEVLYKALSVDFFDAGIYETYRVLTSSGIQERYFAAIERRKKVQIFEEFFLLDPSDVPKNAVWKSATTMPFFKKKSDFEINADNNSINADKNSINDDTNTQSKGKESKGKESKGKESKGKESKGKERERNSLPSDPPIPPSVLDAYQMEIRPLCNTIEADSLADDASRYGEAAVIKAIERAAMRGKRSLKYVEGILKSWEKNGYDEDAPPSAKSNPQFSIAKGALEILDRMEDDE